MLGGASLLALAVLLALSARCAPGAAFALQIRGAEPPDW